MSFLSSATRNITETLQKLDAAKTKRRLVIMFAAALLTALMIYIIRSAVKVIKRHREFSLKNPRRALSARCAHLFELRNYASGKKDENISYGELFGLLESKGLIENGAVFCEEFEKLLFSASDEKAEAFAPLIEKLIFARKKMFGEMRFTQKLKYCFIDVLW
ncbi:MAG: hypothetical protein IK063_05185 [Clostridia bacterium]|nr:hypothetical protein [Clostridia bacterium]